MSTGQKYSNPPLVEAILEFQAALPGKPTPDTFLQCQPPVLADYPRSRPFKLAQATLAFGDELTAVPATQLVGHTFGSADGLQHFLAWTGGFTFSRQKPYEGWERFSGEAVRLWDVYRAVAGEVRVTRVGVRYVNKIDLPNPTVELKEYLRTTPEISPALPQMMADFFMQVTIALPEIKSHVTLTESPAPSPGPGTVSIYFDLDLYRTADLPRNEAGLWGLVEQFRETKDDVFEACITDKLRELIR